MLYRLYYWPGIQGRGEYVRLALEEAGARYLDLALVPAERGGGVPALEKFLQGADIARPPFAPPFLKAGRQLIAQTANILLFLGPRLQLVPRDAAGRLWVHQLQLTLADFVTEIHDTHHPLGSGLYYAQQKAAARRRSKDFISHRLPKFLNYFETVLERNGARRSGARRSPWMVGRSLTYVDLSMAQVIAGLQFAFPKASRAKLRLCPRLRRLHEAAFARPNIQRYLHSGRRVAFNNDGIFRHYPELER
jgi:glutathione S-transferase